VRRLLLTTLLVCAGLTGCSGASDGDQSATCLYAATTVYPTWDPANGPVLENLAECKKLTAAQRTTLRDQMTAFVNAAQSKKGN
jgi:ABC-type glycerol-3-phosphate transport system substrate-binding protein